MSRAWIVALVAVATACGSSHSGTPDGGTRMDGSITLSDGSIDPTRDGSIDPTRDGSIDPTRDGSIDPGRDGSIDPTRDGSTTMRDAGDPTMRGGVGALCTTDEDCDGRFCSTGSSGIGYCSWVCARDVPCPDSAVCVMTTDTYGYCLLGCDPAMPRCPMGTVCRGDFGLPEPVCYTGCESDTDCPMGTECGDRFMGFGRCLTPSASNGAPCTRDEDCPASSFCADEPTWGFSRGICIRWGCEVGTNVGCAADTTCVTLGLDGTICLPDCMVSGDCRAGYECVPAPGGASSVCLPRCSSDAQCTGGRRCDFLTSRCVDW